MSSKLLLFVFGLLALSCTIEAKSFFKKFHMKQVSAAPVTIGGKALEHIRTRRDADSASDSDETDPVLNKFFFGRAWKNNKLDVLVSFLSEMGKNSETNLTLVGWQKVVDEQGNVKEIDTVQLVIPTRPIVEGEKKQEDNEYDDEDDEEDEGTIPHTLVDELKEILDNMDQMGIPGSASVEKYNKHGEEEVVVYMNKDELFVRSEGFSIYNKTYHLSQPEVEAFIQKQKSTIYGKPTVLRYDVDGHLKTDQSSIYAPLLGSVIDHYEAPDDVFLESPKIVAQITAQYDKKDVPEHLAKKYNEEFPEYTWRVLVDPAYHYVTKDTSVTVAYDNLEFDENNNITYVVYGIKKSTE